MKNFSKNFLLLVFPLLLLGACAKMGTLSGGEMDEDPPEVVNSQPENYSTNFEGESIEITFDEFIQLVDVNQELVISPPLENRPDVRLRNKSIYIDLNNELRESTTYTLNFGSSIKDNNEGNELTNFEFVFSTGDYLDSLSISGNILRAFNLEPPEEPINIMLYDNLSDSVVFKDIPVYIGKSSEDGTYMINNLKADTFKIFALNDANNNFLFDLPNEQIAFLDSTIHLTPEVFSSPVSPGNGEETGDSIVPVQRDTLNISDSLNLIYMDEDSLRLATNESAGQLISIDLFLFTQESESQFLADYNRSSRRRIDFSFNLPVTDSFAFYSLVPDNQEWYLPEISEKGENYVLWIVDDAVIQMDSIKMMLKYVVQDSTGNNIWERDTLDFTYREPSSRSRRDQDSQEEQGMEMTTIRDRAVLDLNEEVQFTSETPVNNIDTSQIEFYRMKDTVITAENYRIYKDTANLRVIRFDKDWESGGEYRFVAYPGAFMDAYGAVNDTIDARFSVRDQEYYGTLIVNIDTVSSPLIIQLLSAGREVLREKYITEMQDIRFEYLRPGSYRLKIIYDTNNNQQWDTGEYITGRQPEKVQFYPGEIEIRANWELGVNVEIGDPQLH